MNNETYKQLKELKSILDSIMIKECFARLKASKKREQRKIEKQIEKESQTIGGTKNERNQRTNGND